MAFNVSCLAAAPANFVAGSRRGRANRTRGRQLAIVAKSDVEQPDKKAEVLTGRREALFGATVAIAGTNIIAGDR